MNNAIEHIEHLLCHGHQCVVFPGWGAFTAGYLPAQLLQGREGGADRLLPPSIPLHFNAELDQPDGLLAHSVARRNGLTYEGADRLLREEADAMRHQLDQQGELAFGRLGMFTKAPGEPMVFTPAENSPVNARFFGLQPVEVRPLEVERAATPATASLPAAASQLPQQEAVPATTTFHPWRRTVAVAAASVAAVVTLGLYVFTPSQDEAQSVRAAVAPVPVATVAVGQPVGDAPELPDHLTIAAPAEAPIKVAPKPTVEAVAPAIQPTPAAPIVAKTPSMEGPYCLIVASFPTEAQAKQYLAENSSRKLGVIEKDGRFRVFAATANSRSEAEALKGSVGVKDAWVCRR